MEPLKTVAFADDELGIHLVLERACGSAYQIVGKAQNGIEAVNLVKMMKPQLLVLDFHMPGMNGLEALSQIVPLQTTAVVVLTANQDPEMARRAMDLGACGYMTKPFDISQIVPMFETAWHTFQTAKGLRKEISTLSDSLETRKLLEKAKGILIEQQGFTEDEAHKMLQKMSQDQGITVKELCRSLIQVKMILGGKTKSKKVA